MSTPLLRELEKTWDRRDPEAEGVIEPARRVPWGVLLAEGSRLGTEIRDACPKEAPVAIDCGRSAESVATVMGCLLAQRPFVLLDEDLPLQRREWIFTDSAAAAVITRSVDPVPGADGVRPLLARCAVGATSLGKTLTRTHEAEDPERPVYRIYTSGSTGQPKGASVPARSIAGLLPALAQRIPSLGSARCIGVNASFGFDASLQQIFLGLFAGTTLAIPSVRVVRAVHALIGFWREAEVDLADATPTLMRMLAAAPVSCGPSLPLKTLLVGGEVMRGEDPLKLWSRFGSELEIFNLYGVAECGIDATAHEVALGDGARPFVPVGEPLAHCRVFIADREGRALADGETGELHIEGDAVGTGYPTDPGLTAQRFTRREGEVVYRTGDLARRNPDGAIVVQGRLDRQMKVGGRRVDPGELEHLLVDWSRTAVKRTRVTPDPAAVKRCRACVLSVAHPDAEIDSSGLCRFCRTLDQGVASGWGHFRPLAELCALIDKAKRQSSEFDAVLLFSGGKDSTYALYRLHDLGARVLAFTFDNGFISPAALENIQRIVTRLGVPHRFLAARDNRALLAESLRAEATVCAGCFKGITLLGARLAAEVGAPIMISGLSRGQIIETKLVQFLRRGRDDLTDIDGELEDHLLLYLARRDSQSEAVGGDSNLGFPIVPLVDYFRYDDASPAEIMDFLAARDPAWLIPDDTGLCSSNCRANDIGIAEHLHRRGFHNYESPLSWEVRLGMIDREEALRQVNYLPDEGIVAEGRRSLNERCEAAVVQGDRGELLALLQGGGVVGTEGLRSWLAQQVPDYMHPARVEIVDELPRLASGKVDYRAIRSHFDPVPGAEADVFTTETERRISAAWQRVLGRPPSCRDAIFFDEGGDSLAATELAVELEEEFEVTCEVGFIFEAPSLAGMVERVRSLLGTSATEVCSEATPDPVRMTVSSPAPADADRAMVMMPGLLGGAEALRPLFEGLARETSSLVVSVQFEPGLAWGDKPSLPALAAEICARLQPREENLLVAGWSFGALLAEHVAAHLEASHAGHGQIQAWLIDPPTNLDGDLLDMRREVVSGMRAGLPQFRAQLADDGVGWTQLALLVERVSRYRGGSQRVTACMPPSVKRHLSRPDAQGSVAENLLGLFSAFEALSDPSLPIPSEAPGVTWTVIQSEDLPLGATPPLHRSHARRCSWVSVAADHNGVLDPSHRRQYSQLLHNPQQVRSTSQ